jgi:DNA ligase (NAD+)
MLQEGVISSIPDLYNIDPKALAGLEGFGMRSSRIVTEAILEKSQIELWRFIRAMGIEGAGKTLSKALANEFKTLDAIRNVSASELCGMDGIGEITAEAIVKGLEKRSGMIDELLQYVDIIEVETKNGVFTGKSFCVTGTLTRKRSEIHAMIEAQGGTVKSSVGKGLDYLVAGANVGAGKTAKAEKYGTEVISEDELMEMVN